MAGDGWEGLTDTALFTLKLPMALPETHILIYINLNYKLLYTDNEDL